MGESHADACVPDPGHVCFQAFTSHMASSIPPIGKQKAEENKQRNTSEDSKEDLDLLDWGAVFSARAQAAKEFLEDLDSQYTVISFSIVMEPITYLTRLFLKSASAHKRPCDVPISMSLASDIMSPVVQIMQYYTALARGASSRSVLLFDYEKTW